MSGTRTGGLKVKEKNLAKDPDFYKKIGSIGGKNGTTGGFASDVVCRCELMEGKHFKRQCAGKRGGMASRRTKNA